MAMWHTETPTLAVIHAVRCWKWWWCMVTRSPVLEYQEKRKRAVFYSHFSLQWLCTARKGWKSSWGEMVSHTEGTMDYSVTHSCINLYLYRSIITVVNCCSLDHLAFQLMLWSYLSASSNILHLAHTLLSFHYLCWYATMVVKRIHLLRIDFNWVDSTHLWPDGCSSKVSVSRIFYLFFFPTGWACLTQAIPPGAFNRRGWTTHLCFVSFIIIMVFSLITTPASTACSFRLVFFIVFFI